jgi:uncharacterized protein (DUF3820 family)
MSFIQDDEKKIIDILKHEIKNHTINYEKSKLLGWRYVGGDFEHHLNYFKIAFPKHIPIPPFQDHCLCNHSIIRQCYITDGETAEVIGSCCIKKFLPPKYQKRTCVICKKPHKNSKNNFCGSCRTEYLTTENLYNLINYYKIKFGKYTDYNLSEIYKTDKHYIGWIRRNIKDVEIQKNIKVLEYFESSELYNLVKCKITFGKYANHQLQTVYDYDKKYIDWMIKNIDNDRIKQNISLIQYWYDLYLVSLKR